MLQPSGPDEAPLCISCLDSKTGRQQLTPAINLSGRYLQVTTCTFLEVRGKCKEHEKFCQRL